MLADWRPPEPYQTLPGTIFQCHDNGNRLTSAATPAAGLHGYRIHCRLLAAG